MGVIVNALLLLCMYWKLLSIEKDEEDVAVEVIAEEEAQEELVKISKVKKNLAQNFELMRLLCPLM
ncbi:hypothetical protein CFP56_016555 [Quercus suber]|uniref:Uncharacterized protein n=1 Tax=Quercus suber TaxID=58331 RepID=A0AAW0M4M8_QUESU